VQVDPTYIPARVTRLYTLLACGDVEAARVELERLERSGHGDYRGVGRARQCANLPAPRAQRCIGTPAR
jgi:hypothetical protein